MPADHGLRPDDLQSVQHARCQPIQSGKYQTVDAGEGQSLRRFTSQHVELMTKRQDLACSDARDRNNPISAKQIRLQTSLINQEHRPIRFHSEEDADNVRCRYLPEMIYVHRSLPGVSPLGAAAWSMT